jgi:hypothetical protein
MHESSVLLHLAQRFGENTTVTGEWMAINCLLAHPLRGRGRRTTHKGRLYRRRKPVRHACVQRDWSTACPGRASPSIAPTHEQKFVVRRLKHGERIRHRASAVNRLPGHGGQTCRLDAGDNLRPKVSDVKAYYYENILMRIL